MKALIIGSEGQDGKLLSQLLLQKGYEVWGIGRSKQTAGNIHYVSFDLANADSATLATLITQQQFSEIYYLAAHHHSSSQAEREADLDSIDKCFSINLQAFSKVLEICLRHSSATRIFYASSSLIFSLSGVNVQKEDTPVRPNCYYSIAKQAGMEVAKKYRSEGLFVSTGILYNHESIYRKDYFLSKKIVNEVHKLLKGEIKEIVVGDLNAQTDWGYAPDYVAAMHHILQLSAPGDFIISSGTAHKVKDWFEVIFSKLNMDWKEYVREDKNMIIRKKPVLVGDNSKLKATGWQPTVSFEDMAIRMFENRL